MGGQVWSFKFLLSLHTLRREEREKSSRTDGGTRRGEKKIWADGGKVGKERKQLSHVQGDVWG